MTFPWKRTGKAAIVPPVVLPTIDKQVGDLHWRTALTQLHRTQEMITRATWEQNAAAIDFGHIDRPIKVICVSDLHWGSWATDYEVITRVLDEILSTPDLYVVFIGDLEHMAINPRGVAEFTDNMVQPHIQHAITESVIEDLAPKILFSTWDNHSVQRQEVGSGMSEYARLMGRSAVYFNGIGHADVKVGGEVYRFAASHRFRGSTGINPTRGQIAYMLQQSPDREIAVGGDVHTPEVRDYVNGPIHRLAVNVGTAQTASPYGRRHFSLFSHAVFPVLTLDPERHVFNGFWSMQHLLSAQRTR